MKKYFLEGPEDYKLMSQAGVKQYCYPLDSTHNSIWDSNVGPDGKLYYALASEICTSGYVRLCRYDFDTNEVEQCFAIEDVILPSDRTIRASKFHSSISFMKDGKMVMTTHTTDKSPAHPTWMPEAYFHHIWEGFTGGNIIQYDPKTKEAKNLGMPAPRESIYGSLYEPAHNALYFLGFFKGHLYRYSFDEKKVKDLGKVSERYSFRLTLGPDGNIYGASKTGYVFKVDTETQQIVDMQYKLVHNPQGYSRDFTNISIGRTGPDGRLYFAVMYGRSIIALDTATGKFEDVGEYLDTEHYCRGENRNGIFGMDFDSEGVLWYVISSRNDEGTELEYGLPASLFRWDITRGGKPEWMGICGTDKRVGSWVSEVCINKNDVLFVVGSNHGVDGPDITAIDLKKFRPHMRELGGNTHDSYYDKNDAHYKEVARTIKALEKISEENPYRVPFKIAAKPVLLWRALAPYKIDESAVQGMYWEDRNTLTGICGTTEEYVFTIHDQAIQSVLNIKGVDAERLKRIKENISAVKSDCDSNALPALPGRAYKAKASASVKMYNGKTVVGTQDGMVAVVSGKKVFSLGTAAYNGPVRSLSVTPDGKKVYGVAGDEEDMGVLFSYDEDMGLRWLGHAEYDSEEEKTSFFLSLMSCCAVSPDGSILAVASGDRMGTVVFYKI